MEDNLLSPDVISGPDTLDLAIGARIRLRRKSLSLSQSKLADRLKVTFQQVQRYERADNRVSGSTLIMIAEALDTSVGWLVGEEHEEDSEAEALLLSLAIPGAQELLEAFVAIPSPAARRTLIELARQIASDRT
jgi:transcriptional regulator with XRE-family HTH domain